VTTFQVNGQMSGAYAYYVGIAPSSSNGTPYEYEIGTFGNVGAQSDLITRATAAITDIQGTVAGNTWTAYTPLSLIGDSTHLWVFAGTSSHAAATSNCQTNCNSLWIDFYPPLSDPTFFEVTLPTSVHISLQPSLLANNVTLSIDGEQYRFDASGQTDVMLEGGVSHSVSITPVIQSTTGVRYSEATWSDTGTTSNSRSLIVDQDFSITISYRTQFLLSISSDYATTTGEGWYDEASTASISIYPTTVPYAGFLGTLNLRHQFNGWAGDVQSTSTKTSVYMDSPKNVAADWSTVYGVQFILFLCLLIAVPVFAIVLLYERRWHKRPGPNDLPDKDVSYSDSKPTSPQRISDEPPLSESKQKKFCLHCGAKIPRTSTFCQECGKNVVAE